MDIFRPLIIADRGWTGRYPAHSLAGLAAATGVADAVMVGVRRSGDGKLLLWDDAALGGREVTRSPWIVLSNTDLGSGHRPALLDEALAALSDLPVLMSVPNAPGSPGFEPDHRHALEAASRARPGDAVLSDNPRTLERVVEQFEDLWTGLVLSLSHRLPDSGTVVVDWRSGLASEAVAAGASVLVRGVEDPVAVGELAAIGVSGIITGQPDLVRAALEERS